MSTLFKLENASIGWERETIIRGLNLTIQAGEHWALVGPTGSGKSLLLSVLAEKRSILNGTFQAIPAKKDIELVASDFSFNRNIAATATFYQQRFNSYASEESPTVWEVLQEQVKPAGTVDAHSVELPPLAYDEDYLQQVATQLRVSHLLERHVTSLSNGETRRTLLTRSFLKKPKVLILDNPFVGLDVTSRASLHEILNHIAGSGTTLLMVAPPADIPSAITNVLVLPQGTSVTRANYVPTQDLTERKVIELPKPLTEHVDFSYAIHMRNISIRYGETQVLDHVNWAVKRGEKWALLGPNGSGKSTLLSLITGDNPQAYANDFDLFDRKRGTGESIWDIKKKIGFVSPELHLYFPRDQNVWKVIASGLFDTMGLFKVLKPDLVEYLEAYIAAFELQDLKEKKLSQLSTGQQRLVLLARALVKNPPLLILDEPCQGLDTDQMTRFRDTVDALSETSERTLVYVSHYTEEIPTCVTHTIRLNQGKVVEMV
ncbi:ATP-binding cassette domain-containing protein [Siphonobacter sp. SORGH_AS_1065]|uniref:ATP-binding cassette domain-containing protein n=1 Tax=Siphonobacter sp. SORGH_AS_1065 TaxID=3041795 RepID=UPI00277DCC0F|nr:ATP-binding cassette domain-containing protein [Siphonobacter sp. SORGH_AS_1065]MDQ1085890.1 molybdate transport system ATP-binding protein [Siphonobacter sp. SORGH_AS_1065]